MQVVSLILDELEKGSSILCDGLMENENVAVGNWELRLINQYLGGKETLCNT